jgi:hypothetical protein
VDDAEADHHKSPHQGKTPLFFGRIGRMHQSNLDGSAISSKVICKQYFAVISRCWTSGFPIVILAEKRRKGRRESMTASRTSKGNSSRSEPSLNFWELHLLTCATLLGCTGKSPLEG